jgi:hypothetical protein
MNARRLAVSALCLLLGVAAAEAAKVRSWQDPQYDFAKPKTYRWDRPAGPAEESLDRRIRSEIRSELAKRGLREQTVEGEPADVAVLYITGMADTLVAGFDLGVGWYGELVAVPGTDSSVTAGILIELLDGASGDEVWAATYLMKGNTMGALQMMIDDAEKAVRGAFKKFPKR